MRLAIIIPPDRDGAAFEDRLLSLAPMRRRGHRVVVADDIRRNAWAHRTQELADRVVGSAPGWARQMNAASRAPEAESADALVFLTEGVRLPPQADRAIARALANSASPWGRFDICYQRESASSDLALRLASAIANGLAQATGICTRDQAIFVTRGAFLALGGFAVGAVPADNEFSQRARTLGAPIVLHEPALVSAGARDWRSLLRDRTRQELLRLAFAVGLSPQEPGPLPHRSH